MRVAPALLSSRKLSSAGTVFRATMLVLPVVTFMDKLFLRGFNLAVLIGVYEWERHAPQTVQLDIEIGLPAQRAAQSDDIQDTIDYAKVAEHIRAFIHEREFHLVETLAEQLAQLIFDHFSAIWVQISAAKPGVVPGIERVGVTIQRERKTHS